MTHLNCKSKLLLYIVIQYSAYSQYAMIVAHGSSPIKMIVRMMNTNQNLPSGHQPDAFSPQQDCSYDDDDDDDDHHHDDHASSMLWDSMMELKDHFDKFTKFDKLGRDSTISEPEQFTNEVIIDNDIAARQQDNDCPTTSVSKGTHLDYRLSAGRNEPQLQPQAPLNAISTVSLGEHMNKKSRVIPYSGETLAERRKQLVDKFPFKSSKLSTPRDRQLVAVLPQVVQEKSLQIEQQKSLDTINQEPVMVKSVIPNYNLKTGSEQVWQQQQQDQQQQADRVLDNETLGNAINVTRTQEDNSVDLTTGVLDDGFETSTQATWQGDKKPIGIVQGQRARDTFLFASNFARSLNMKSSKPT